MYGINIHLQGEHAGSHFHFVIIFDETMRLKLDNHGMKMTIILFTMARCRITVSNQEFRDDRKKVLIQGSAALNTMLQCQVNHDELRTLFSPHFWHYEENYVVGKERQRVLGAILLLRMFGWKTWAIYCLFITDNVREPINRAIIKIVKMCNFTTL